MVYSGQSLYPWHIDRDLTPNERLAEAQKKRVGYFVFHENTWYLVNENMAELVDVASKTPVPPGGSVPLRDGTQLLTSRQPGGRLLVVQMVNTA